MIHFLICGTPEEKATQNFPKSKAWFNFSRKTKLKLSVNNKQEAQIIFCGRALSDMIDKIIVTYENFET